MLKILGSILIAAASIGIAFSIRRDLSEHLRLLYEIRRLFVDISYEAAYSMQPVEILLGSFVKPKDERLLHICREIADRLLEKKNGTGEEIFSRIFEEHRKELGLNEEETEIIQNAGNAFFGKSMDENNKNLALALERLDFVIEHNRKEQKEKQKVYQIVSVMSGLMLIILLI